MVKEWTTPDTLLLSTGQARGNIRLDPRTFGGPNLLIDTTVLVIPSEQPRNSDPRGLRSPEEVWNLL